MTYVVDMVVLGILPVTSVFFCFSVVVIGFVTAGTESQQYLLISILFLKDFRNIYFRNCMAIYFSYPQIKKRDKSTSFGVIGNLLWLAKPSLRH